MTPGIHHFQVSVCQRVDINFGRRLLDSENS